MSSFEKLFDRLLCSYFALGVAIAFYEVACDNPYALVTARVCVIISSLSCLYVVVVENGCRLRPA